MTNTSTSPHRAARAPRRDAAENRIAILDAAISELNHNPDASLETIASAAGLSRRSIYGHFSTRDELVAELNDRGIARVTAALAPIRHDDARVALALVGARLWSEVEDVRVTAQLAIRGPRREIVAEGLDPVRRGVLAIVEQGVAAGQLRTDIEPRTLARLIEGAALSVLDEAVRDDISHGEGHRLVILVALSTAGLSWREAAELIDASPELALEAQPPASSRLSERSAGARP
ncbi:TetR/AcrR family transcriptional regulator [Agreia pratensis]|uniref:Transcriptional regulator, TetR family n=1 Tax=Agreia pratensis TaxID=150121 RepID=A0A1X7JK02_9MICO|nr:TetR/AcrR family transcriptional regulator [Agreia pratensis]MBF4634901.1 TetR/AcrR family transcriptional regulator [Agreia pratensis]SMG28507.1 transcriptional regulator, TetR family [Agreia pratensis]